MARRRRRSTSLSSRLLSEASRTLPAPLQFALASPSRVAVSLLVLGFLISMGILSINWQDGRPTFQFHQERAQELREKTTEWVEDHGEELLERGEQWVEHRDSSSGRDAAGGRESSSGRALNLRIPPPQDKDQDGEQQSFGGKANTVLRRFGAGIRRN